MGSPWKPEEEQPLIDYLFRTFYNKGLLIDKTKIMHRAERFARQHNACSPASWNSRMRDMARFFGANQGIKHKEAYEAWLNRNKPKVVEPPSVDQVQCPLCDAPMKYTVQGATHIWSCEDCPAVMYEYHSKQNTDDLNTYLESN